jgi:hypothetical protein
VGVPSAGAIEIRGEASALLDEPLVLRARGAGPEPPEWRARLRDDDGRIWRAASGGRSEDLVAGWRPAKASTGPLAELHSLRPVGIEVRVEVADGRAASRKVTRRLVGDGVRVRQWRDDVTATLHLPAQETPTATLLIDATAGPERAAVATLAAPLLASRGVLVLSVAVNLAGAAERLAAVPGTGEPIVLPVADLLDADPGAAVVLPPGVPARDAPDRSAAWAALLAQLGARPLG